MSTASLASITFITLVIYRFDKRRGRKWMFKEKYPNFHSDCVLLSLYRFPIARPASWACDVYRRAPGLAQCFLATILHFIIFEEGAQYFHFALCPAKYVAGPDYCLFRYLILIFSNFYLHFFSLYRAEAYLLSGLIHGTLSAYTGFPHYPKVEDSHENFSKPNWYEAKKQLP